MPSATSPAATPRIPAWQRLGLKLKAASAPLTAESAPEVGSPKRKRTDKREFIVPPKKIKTAKVGGADLPLTPQLVRKKSVTFTPETKVDDGDSIKQLFNAWTAEQKAQDPSFDLKVSAPVFQTPEPPKVEEQVDTGLSEKERRVKRVQKSGEVSKSKDKPKAKKARSGKPSKIVKPTKPTIRPFLEYLKQYHEDKPSWKFNKNHQNHLLKNIFDLKAIPSNYAHLLYHYVRGLQGGVRTRLRDAAIALKVKDQEDGAAGFGDKMADGPEMRARRQQEYEDCCKEYVATMTLLNASTKMGYEEGVLAGLSDFAMKERVAKRMRAEQVMENLATGVGGKFGDESEKVPDDKDSQKRLRINDDTSEKIPRKRKQRTMVDDNTSTSGDSSESDSESDSDRSSGESVVVVAARRINHGQSSSSSSSSSSSEASSSGEESDQSGGEEESDESDNSE